jgi:hypothetical protein
VVAPSDLEVVRVVCRVILSAPVPNVGSTCSSATTGTMRLTGGSSTPSDEVLALVVVDGDGGVASIVHPWCDDAAVLAVSVADGDQLPSTSLCPTRRRTARQRIPHLPDYRSAR